ncbi:1,4-alpha-glucan branching protein [Streptomyces sp. NPDC101062]|uniref:maltokinase N-terminal cap-like domain-containing protein n=1 Tax=unclassified Streptomyces TaxID=2593676 RepID=UPI00381FFC42
MAVIHRTTMTPTKLELLGSWLPTRPWYRGGESAPELSRTGGFRLDDPRGEVGIEFMAVTDVSGDRPLTYHVPLSYRGAPLDGADEALVGTSEHGVLGRRWIYDGAHDPVVVARLLALISGDAEPQAQSVSDTPDPSVVSGFTGTVRTGVFASLTASDGPDGTDLLVRTTAPAGGSGAATATATADAASGGPGEGGGTLALRVHRILRADQDTLADAAEPVGHVTAGWNLPDGTTVRGRYVVVSGTAAA